MCALKPETLMTNSRCLMKNWCSFQYISPYVELANVVSLMQYSASKFTNLSTIQQIYEFLQNSRTFRNN